jgi:gluconolactonase
MKKIFFFALLVITATASCQVKPSKYPLIGRVEKFDPALDAIVSPNAKAEIIAEGFDWSEGPLWIEKQKMLIFSDVPQNTIYKWTEAKGKEVYLSPSGYTDTAKRGGETGSNGLTLDNKGNLVLAQHGDRRIAGMDAPLDNPAAKFSTLAGSYKGKKFNSPNDVIVSSTGDMFLTDPPYGLEKNMRDPKKEIAFQGVYRISRSGEVTLITDTITRPNGIAFLPGERTLLVANSDGQKPNWYAFDIDENGKASNGRIFYSVRTEEKGLKGSPDGMKVDRNGNLFATGPGGIWIISKEGKLLGRIRIDDNPTSNCAFSADEKTLYITNDMYILRVQLRP